MHADRGPWRPLNSQTFAPFWLQAAPATSNPTLTPTSVCPSIQGYLWKLPPPPARGNGVAPEGLQGATSELATACVELCRVL